MDEITLPDRSAAPSTAAAMPRRREAPREPDGQRTVLVVDDQPFVCRVVGRLLKKAGYRVRTAGNGEDALEVLQTDGCDLLLTDVCMPGLDGPELVERALDGHPDLPVVYMSGYVDDGVDPSRVRNHPLLTKPFGSGELYRVVDEALREASAPASGEADGPS